MANPTKRRILLRTLVSLLTAVLLGLGLSGCSNPSPEDITKRDELYKAELSKRGFTDPVKLHDDSGFLGGYTDWGVGLGTCRLEFRIHDGDLNDWSAVNDAATLLTKPQYAQCRSEA